MSISPILKRRITYCNTNFATISGYTQGENGDHYWGRANATPMRDGDKIVDYLSVRTHAPQA